MEYDVTIDRNEYIGGSDIPIIMGISPFKTRYRLLLEKAGLAENDFTGNKYTVYGQTLEPQIREYINDKYQTNFEPNRVYNGVLRCHTDGFNGERVLEIKTTSHIYDTVDEYKVYLVQLLLYMQENNVENGLLVVYERPDDFDTEFDPKKLREFEINANEYKLLTDQINAEISQFLRDLERIKENPLLTEQDFQPKDLVTLSGKVLALETRMAEFKAIEKQYKEMKQSLFDAMVEHDVKSWTMPNGTKITRVDGTAASVKQVTEFDVDAFKAENAALYEMYSKTVEKKQSGRSGYVKITVPK